jgi:hypothetical protein
MSNGWTLILFGSICNKLKENGEIKHSFVPFICSITRTESYLAFTSIIDSFFNCLQLLNISKSELTVLSFSQDHCGAGANGIEYLSCKINKPIIMLDCETHVRRKTHEKRSLLSKN